LGIGGPINVPPLNSLLEDDSIGPTQTLADRLQEFLNGLPWNNPCIQQPWISDGCGLAAFPGPGNSISGPPTAPAIKFGDCLKAASNAKQQYIDSYPYNPLGNAAAGGLVGGTRGAVLGIPGGPEGMAGGFIIGGLKRIATGPITGWLRQKATAEIRRAQV